MKKLLIIPAVAAILIAITTQAGATVTWSFYETSCQSESVGTSCALPPQPFVLAELTLPGPTSSGSADWLGAPGPGPVYTGDRFVLQADGDAPISPAFAGNPSCDSGGGPGSICLFDLSWNEQDGTLTAVAISANWFDDTIRPPFGLSGGVIATDGLFGGCSIAECRVTGYWQSDLPVSEPMAASLLLSGILSVALARRWWRVGESAR